MISDEFCERSVTEEGVMQANGCLLERLATHGKRGILCIWQFDNVAEWRFKKETAE